MKKFAATVTALTALAVAPAANAAIVGPTLVSPAGQDASREQAATAPNGTVVTSWSGVNGSKAALYASRLAGGTVTQLPVFSVPSDWPVPYWQTAVSPAGVTTFVWVERDPGSQQSIGQLKLRRVSASGTRGPVVNLTNPGTRFTSQPVLVTDKSGNSTVVWPDGTADEEHPYVRGIRVSAAGAKSATFTIAQSTGTSDVVAAYYLGAAVATNGTVGLIFGGRKNGLDYVSYSRITNTKATKPVQLNPAGSDGSEEFTRIQAAPAGGFRVVFVAAVGSAAERLYTRAIDSRNKIGNPLLVTTASPQGGNYIGTVCLGVDKNGQASIAWIDGSQVRFARVTKKGKVAGAAQLNGSVAPAEESVSLVTTPAGATSVVWTTYGPIPASASHDAFVEGRRISATGTVGALTRLADAPTGYGWLTTSGEVSASSDGTVTLVLNAYSREATRHGSFLVRWK